MRICQRLYCFSVLANHIIVHGGSLPYKQYSIIIIVHNTSIHHLFYQLKPCPRHPPLLFPPDHQRPSMLQFNQISRHSTLLSALTANPASLSPLIQSHSHLRSSPTVTADPLLPSSSTHNQNYCSTSTIIGDQTSTSLPVHHQKLRKRTSIFTIEPSPQSPMIDHLCHFLSAITVIAVLLPLSRHICHHSQH